MLLVLAPALLGAPLDAPAAAALVALALVTAVVLLDAHRGVVASGPAVRLWPTAVAVAPAVTGGVTDPVHHPIRPRAPGIA
jgi:hypothetical protein